MKMMQIVTLMNQSLDEDEQCRVINVSKAVLDESVAAKGSCEMKELLRKHITELFNGDILGNFNDYEDEVSQKDVDYCISELAKGHASNIAGEDFWWEDAEDLVVDLHK